uniref:C2H2-type domain-containing protein n=1 Tax=Heterorhabditis bacteriophora TaxID=37862 RepID=A0A1I7XPM8_HETBA
MNSGNMSFVPFACVDCPGDPQRYPTIDELEVHIASDHLNYCPYERVYTFVIVTIRCRFAKFPTEYALVSHCKNDHGMKEFYVRYRYSLEGERKLTELKTKVRACLRQRLGATDDSMMVGLGSNAMPTLPATIVEKVNIPLVSYKFVSSGLNANIDSQDF